jgi:hypothetical protein
MKGQIVLPLLGIICASVGLSLAQVQPIQVMRVPEPAPEEELKPLDKSAYLAFVDRDYMFTIEMVKPGVPLLNFVSMSDTGKKLLARDVRLTLDDRQRAGTVFAVDTSDPKQPVRTSSLQIRPRSSFGVRLDGDFGSAKEISGAIVRLDAEEFGLALLSGPKFESLVLKINRINLGSPDFRDDWRLLNLEVLGTRKPVRR